MAGSVPCVQGWFLVPIDSYLYTTVCSLRAGMVLPSSPSLILWSGLFPACRDGSVVVGVKFVAWKSVPCVQGWFSCIGRVSLWNKVCSLRAGMVHQCEKFMLSLNSLFPACRDGSSFLWIWLPLL